MQITFRAIRSYLSSFDASISGDIFKTSQKIPLRPYFSGFIILTSTMHHTTVLKYIDSFPNVIKRIHCISCESPKTIQQFLSFLAGKLNVATFIAGLMFSTHCISTFEHFTGPHFNFSTTKSSRSFISIHDF